MNTLFVVCFFVLIIFFWLRLNPGGSGRGGPRGGGPKSREIQDLEEYLKLKENGGTALSYDDWQSERSAERAEKERLRVVAEREKREKAYAEEIAAGGVRAEKAILARRRAEIESVMSALPSSGRDMKSYVEALEHVYQLKDQLEIDESVLAVREEGEVFADLREKLDLENPGRPYRLKWFDPKSYLNAGGRVAAPFGAGQWRATSTKWGCKGYDGIIVPISNSSISENGAVVGLFRAISERKGRILLPYNPMDEDV